MIYYIPYYNMSNFETKINKLIEKSMKYNNSLEYKQCGTVVRENEDGIPITYHKVEVEGIVGLNGWECISKIESIGNNENVITYYTDKYKIPNYNHSKLICEHCYKNINRRFTFLVRNVETGEFKQVGRACLKDYTGIDPKTVAMLSSLDKTVKDYIEKDNFTKHHKYFYVDKYVKILVELCRQNNNCYIKEPDFNNKYTTMSTAITIYNVLYRNYTYCDYIKKLAQELNYDTKENDKILSKCIKYVNSKFNNLNELNNLNETELNNIENLKVIFKCMISPFQYLSNVTEVVYKFFKDINDVKETISEGEYFGDVGDKFEIIADKFEYVTIVSSEYYSSYLYKFYYKDYTFVWFTSKDINNCRNIKICGTIKSHNIYRNKKETVVTRCKVYETEDTVYESNENDCE